jgi:hypothetical protein
MIQGLGQKHQAWLPEEPEDIQEEANVDVLPDGKADAKVEKWAKAVSESLHEGGQDALSGEEPSDHPLDETRTAHFDRPMKEVRVGESPSRPWGITIPPKYTDAHSSSSVGSAPTASPPIPLKTDRPIGQTPQKAGRCPFDHQALGKTPDKDTPQPGAQTRPQPDPTTPRPPPLQTRPSPQEPRREARASEPPQAVPQMIFNGPVFLGYPPDQLLMLLQNSNLGASLR